jgi:aminoglycoside phosphotransferase (APT) family kinase protein
MGEHDDIADRLAAFLERELGREGLEVGDLRRLSGGASRETWSFDLLDVIHGGKQPLILQRIRAGVVGGAVSMVGESGLLRAAGEAGVPVAPVLAASDDVSIVGAPLLVMGRVEGETIARRILRDDAFAGARKRLVAECGRALAAIHALPPSAAGYLQVQEPISQLTGLLDFLGEPRPAFEIALRWLDDHRPPEVEPSVVHGDFRLGNFMVDEHGLRAVLDWELAHLGDPIEDLGWLCVRAWRFGSDLSVAGLGPYEELIGSYEAASGTTVDLEAVRWWEVLGTLRWGVICIMQAASHLTGASRSVELAAIGRRVCENEYDVLTLIGARPRPEVDESPAATAPASAPASAPAAPGARADLYGASSALELVTAVREFLEGDVMAATQGRVQFHARVAGKVLATVERELDAGPGPVLAHAARLEALGFTDDAGLAAAIRSGRVDPGSDAVRHAVWLDVLAQLRVANPAHLLPEDRLPGAG